ncbi:MULTISPECIES: hypothetical protein [unclassified Mesorhizobium]|uniref:NACHT domain-containing protein n=1 Tax=unclassified Mesorhizobium TaxID=325217 RepID=UPI00333B04A8
MSRKPQSTQKTSAFARVLQQLLDESGFYTRAEWSQFLGISAPALSQWTNDRTVPRPDLFRMVIDLLKTRGGGKAGIALMAVESIMDEPSEKISPIGSRFAPNLRAYLSVRSIGALGRSLREQPVKEQIAILRDGGASGWAAGANAAAPVAETGAETRREHGLGPAWRVPRLLGASGPHGREQLVAIKDLADSPRVVLIGAPGSGKTSCLSYLMAHFQNWRDAEGLSLRNRSAAEFGDWLTARGANQPTLPLVLDGLDEMPMDHREQVVPLIESFCKQRPEIRLLVASRPLKQLDRLESFDRFSIAPLSDVDLVSEITHSSLASRSPVEVDRFLCHLTERDSLRTALRNPLFIKSAWSLFENKEVTPFSESIIVEEYLRVLLDRDHRNGFSRVREPWATSHSLLVILGEISLKLLNNNKFMFDETALSEWIGESSRKVPIGKLLDLLLVLGLLTEDDQQYRFSHRVLLDYFAARFVIDSASSAADYFTSARKHIHLSGAMRMACGLASDATSLLETAMSSRRPDGSKFPLLAEMLAQPIFARSEVLDESCSAVVSWLEDRTCDWKVVEDDPLSNATSAKWHVCAHVNHAKEVSAVEGTLRAIHQARSGPAYDPLKIHLSEARSPFLPIFSEAMDVEGRLKVNFETGHTEGIACVAVENLQLA